MSNCHIALVLCTYAETKYIRFVVYIEFRIYVYQALQYVKHHFLLIEKLEMIFLATVIIAVRRDLHGWV